MDRYSVSGEDLRKHYPPGTLLGQVFCDIERELEASDFAVCQFIVNGIPLAEAEEEKYSKMPLSDVVTLEYLCDSTSRLLLSVCAGWRQAIPEMILHAEQLSGRLRFESMQTLYHGILELIKNCEVLVNSLSTIRAYMGEEVVARLPEWSLAEEKTKLMVYEADGAMRQKELLQLADILEYDLINCLEMWKRVLGQVEGAMNGFQSASDSSSMVRRRLAN
ncbi:MAG: hypothetical protein N2578_00785 [Bdellovibrionaceae bacterium]|nr:hypothetical protein [Pseudobdellovibrionaceae bacterium]